MAEKPEIQVEELLARTRAGDRAAFDELIAKFERPVLRLALYLTRNWHDAEDAAQETYVKIVQKAPALESWERLEAWVLRVTANTVSDLRRRRRRRPPIGLAIRRAEPGKELESRELRGRLMGAIGELSFTERAAFVLRELQEFSTEEVAAVLECRPATVRGYLLTARRKLQQRLEEWSTRR